MAKPARIAWDSTCFVAWADRKETEDPDHLRAIDVMFREMVEGRRRIVASRAIEIEVRPGNLHQTREFHQQLRACATFESFGESDFIRRSALSLADRVQDSGRKGGYADLIHVATAIAARATEMWTTDRKVVNWYVLGVIPEIRICLPYLDQGVLDLEWSST